MPTNKNNVSQTLFKFVSLRNPKLTETKPKNLGFILRPDKVKGVFDGVIFANLLKKADEFQPSSIKSVKELEDGEFAKLLTVGRKISRGEVLEKEETDYTSTYYRGTLDANKQLTAKGLKDYTAFWDNLIYQTLTQKDFYIKESVIHILKALQSGFAQNLEITAETKQINGDDFLAKSFGAKVALPKEIFQNQESNPSKITEEAGTPFYNDKNIKFAEAKLQLDANTKLVSVLQKVENNYRKEYKQAYDMEFEKYQASVNPAQNEYKNSFKEAESRKQAIESRVNYLTNLSAGDPEAFIKNPILSGELSDLTQELINFKFPKMETTEFRLDFRQEITPDELQGNLDEESKNTLNRILGTTNTATGLSGITTYAELQENISQNTLGLQQMVLENTVLNEQITANIGGIPIPVNTGSSTSSYIPYSVKTIAKSATEWSILLTVDNYSHHIVSGSYKATINGTTLISSNVLKTAAGVNMLFDSNPRITTAQTASTGGFILQGDVTLSDGKLYSLDVTLIRDPYDIDRITKQGVFKGSAAFTAKIKTLDPGGSGTVTQITAPFVPSGFGMKSIGVADYLKVEQSLQGYVEGEVAHIENVMARERREKSTKKTTKSEITTMESSDSEKEQLRDTSSTERYEMQSEIAKVIQKSKDINVSAHVEGSYGPVSFGVAGSYATHNAQEESVKQATTQAKEITQKATDRLISRVHKERTEKMIEEFEETNIHEFDNRKGDKHVVGVYRWVDKIMKNQIYNYGKRMMFEFMIPEPAKLHTLGMKISKNMENQLVKPVDPRESVVHTMKDYTSLNDETVLKYWLSKYNVALESELKPEYIFTGKSFAFKADEVKDNSHERYGEGVELEIPEGYESMTAIAQWAESWDDPNRDTIKLIIGDKLLAKNYTTDISGYQATIPISYSAMGHLSGNMAVKIRLKLTEQEKNKQKQAIFNKIIASYEKAKLKYEQDLATIKSQGAAILGSNPGFYRQIENIMLKRNCLSYMINQNPLAALTFGKNKYYKTNTAEESFLNSEIKVDGSLDQYSAFVKFMEQAFEWDIMSYFFYPYFWGNRDRWNELYQFDDNDATFRAFMQAGMARVIVTVRPGFEEAVKHYLTTGQIWNGGEVPVISDDLFLSIVDEMRKTEGEKYGKAWPTRLPTALTILQAQTIGLNVTKALPFDDDLSDYANAANVPQSAQIAISDSQLGAGQSTEKPGRIQGQIKGLKPETTPEIMLKNMDKSPVDFTNPDNDGFFWLENIPVGKYELCLDENDDLRNEYYINEGKITQVVTIKEDDTLTVDLSVSKI